MPASLSAAQELLATLVAFDTTSAKSNLKLIDFVRDTLASHGVTATLTPIAGRVRRRACSQPSGH